MVLKVQLQSRTRHRGYWEFIIHCRLLDLSLRRTSFHSMCLRLVRSLSRWTP